MKISRIINLLSTVILLIFLPQCVTEPEPVPPSQTRILAVKVEPNPVVVGDTATFTCIIQDSLDKRFKFRWGIDGHTLDTVTNENMFKWVAPNAAKEYYHYVYVDNGAKDSVAPSTTFSVKVIN